MRRKLGALESAIEEVIIAEEIRDGHAIESSAVDQPAIDRPFTMFKGMSVGFRNPPVSDYTSCLARGNMPTPGTCEGGTDEDHPLGPALEADYAGHDFEHDYAHAKAVPEGVDPAVFDQCVMEVIAAIENGELIPDDPNADPKEVGFAMCTASGAGAGKGASMSRKDVAPVPELGQVIDFPNVREQVDTGDIEEIAKDQGLTAEQGTAVAEAVMTEFRAPWDANLAALPADQTAEEIVASVAKSLGFTQTGTPMALKGKSRWIESVKRLFGVDRTPAATALAKQLKGMSTRLEESMADQEKSKNDWREAFQMLMQQSAEDRRFMARALGIEMPAAAPAAAPVLTAHPAPAKSVKEDPAAAAAAPPSDLEARVTRIEDAVGQILTALGASPAGGGEVAEPVKRVSTPPEVPAARRFGAKRAGGAPGGDTVYSTYFGQPISRADRESARQAAGLPRYSQGG